MDTFTLVPPAPAPVVRERRTAADLGFILRYVMRWQRLTQHQTILKRLEAELVWSVSNYKAVTGDYGNHDARYDGPHPAEAHRLPHEIAAAVALNAWGHVVVHKYRWRECKARLKAQREAGWHAHAIGTVDDIRACWQARRRAWRVFLTALRRYRELRAEVDRSPTSPAACARAAA